jgi:peptide/nickel transport system permease protein
MRYLVRRLLQLLPTLFAIVVISFALVQLIPGDAARTLAGEEADEASLAMVRAEYDLDEPIPTQFAGYAGRLVRGDLGHSYSYSMPVTSVIRRALPSTVLLTGTALAISTVVGIMLGVVAARRPFGLLDHAIGAVTLTAFAVPGFWLAQVAILVLVLRWKVFPLEGYAEFGPGAATGLGHVADVGYHLMLPALVLATSEVAAVARITRSGLLSQLGLTYTRVAEAKGMSRDDVLSRHALRNALLPVVTLVGTRVGFLFSGAVVIESLFSWPGLGGVLRSAATTSKDPPLLLGIVIVTSLAIVVANVVTDLVYTWIDPRVRLG